MKALRHQGDERTARAVDKARRTWFGRMGALFRGPRLDDGLWDQLEELLISADVGVGPAQDLLERLRRRLREEGVTQPQDALDLLKGEMVAILTVGESARRLDVDVEDAPLVMLMVGVNGSGKTTSIAKLAHLYGLEGKRVLLAAADTFRAAAIDQLQAWGGRLGVDVIAHKPGADPGAVAFDCVQAAKARGADVAIIDTAGQLHTRRDLMDELKKIRRVVSGQVPEESQRVILTLDATTGQNGLLQARSFTEALQCDGVFLAKLDGTAKGGIVVAISDELKVPVLYIGTGEQPDDIATFNPREFVDALFQPTDPV